MARLTPTSRVGRRTVLGGTLATLVTTSGCDLGSLRGSDAPSATPTSGATRPASGPATTDPTQTAAPDQDQAVVDDALAAIVAAGETARANAKAYPRLRAALEPLVVLHERHTKTLTVDAAPRAPRVRAARSGAAAHVAVVHAEDRLQQVLVASAVTAASGVLAAELASMAAAVAQHRVAL